MTYVSPNRVRVCVCVCVSDLNNAMCHKTKDFTHKALMPPKSKAFILFF